MRRRASHCGRWPRAMSRSSWPRAAAWSEENRLGSRRAGHPQPEALKARGALALALVLAYGTAALWASAQTYGRVGRPQCSLCTLSELSPTTPVAPTPQERGRGACERCGAVRAADGGQAHAVQVCRLRGTAGGGGGGTLCQRPHSWRLEAATVSPSPLCDPVCSGGGSPRREWRAG